MFNFPKPDAFINLRGLKALKAVNMLRTAKPAPPVSGTPLRETASFGSNPGQLRMLSYVPRRTDRNCPLVVVLHGCGQTAADYGSGAGWLAMADRYSFALLMPEQQRSNNPNGCFNWFQPEDTRRGGGEAASIYQMIQTMVRDSGVDPLRVFVTGLSAGGAMTSVMLACYPDAFSAGAIVAGLPYGAAANVQQALSSMYQSPRRPAEHWGDMVRNASPRRTSWPRISVWHGTADKTVIPANAGEIIKQWAHIHGLPESPSKDISVDGFQRQVWLNDAGEELIEYFSIKDMAHGTPLATGDDEFACGNAGPFLLEAGISSSFHIARFFGLTAVGAQAAGQAQTSAASRSIVTALPDAANGQGPMPAPHEHLQPKSTGHRIDIGSVIAAALKKAGLMARG